MPDDAPGGSFRATWGPGPIPVGEGQRMRLDPVELVNAAIAGGKIHPKNRDAWLIKLARGGTQAGQAVTDLLHMWPADPATRASWVRGAAPDLDPEDPYGVMPKLWPDGVSGPPCEPDRLAQLEQRLPRAAGGSGVLPVHEAAEDGEHPPTTTSGHLHTHGDYQGGRHSQSDPAASADMMSLEEVYRAMGYGVAAYQRTPEMAKAQARTPGRGDRESYA